LQIAKEFALCPKFDIIIAIMAKRAFYTFHYRPDHWRASQVRNIGSLEGNSPTTDNEWESITRGGDDAIQNWIDEQMSGKSCVIVLIGTETSGRKWITYEIIKGWNEKKGVFGIHVHNLKDARQLQSVKGGNPFSHVSIGGSNGPLLSTIVDVYDPPYFDSSQAYNYIRQNLTSWVDAAIATRNAH
jgi:hypothetical protein